jgi:hypothetical protein
MNKALWVLAILATSLFVTTYAFAKDEEPELRLVAEAKFEALLGEGRVYEGSGVVAVDGRYHVAFDNLAQIAVVDSDLDARRSRLVGTKLERGQSDHEAITYDPKGQCFYVSVESARAKADDPWRSILVQLDRDLKVRGRWWLEPAAEAWNKGVEGLVSVRRGEELFLLALMEGNHAAAGDKAKDKGNGRVWVYRRQADAWIRVAVIELPRAWALKDYAGIDLRGDRLAIVSQSSSKLWIGALDRTAWSVKGPGKLYRFPRGEEPYGNVEGVSWLTDTRFVFVSDEAKPNKPNCEAKAQSIHIFELPAGDR